jgi:hypothetical protein
MPAWQHIYMLGLPGKIWGLHGEMQDFAGSYETLCLLSGGKPKSGGYQQIQKKQQPAGVFVNLLFLINYIKPGNASTRKCETFWQR